MGSVRCGALCDALAGTISSVSITLVGVLEEEGPVPLMMNGSGLQHCFRPGARDEFDVTALKKLGRLLKLKVESVSCVCGAALLVTEEFALYISDDGFLVNNGPHAATNLCQEGTHNTDHQQRITSSVSPAAYHQQQIKHRV
jgi:hypothetical protein